MINKDVLFPLNGWLSRNTSKKMTVPLSLGILARELLMVLTCFLMGRAVLFEQMAPFGIGIFAVLLSKKKGGFTAFLAVTAGAISFRLTDGGFLKFHGGTTILAMLIFALLWNLFGRKSNSWSAFRTAFSVSLSLLVANIVLLLFDGFLMYEMLMGIFESIVGFVTVYIFSLSVDVLWDIKRRQVLSGEEMICLCIFLSLLIIGFWEIQILGFPLRNILTIFLTLLFAYVGGAGIGATVGITAGFMLSLASTPDPALMGNLAICGLLAGVFRELGRPGSGIAFLLANILMTFYINRSTYVILPFGEIAGAIVLLLLVPRNSIEFMKRFLHVGAVRGDEQNYYGKRVQELTVGRLSEFARVFRHLSKVFGRISDRSSSIGQEELSKLFDMVAGQVCSACPLYRSCWERDLHHTYTGIFELLSACEEKGVIERKDVPANMARRCLNVNSLVDGLNQIYKTYRNNMIWHQRMNDCRQLVAEQLEGVGQVVTELAAELDMDIRFRSGFEDAIRLELDKKGIHAKEILALEKPGGKLEISIRKPGCNGKRECLTQIEPIVSKIIGKPMSRQYKECTRGGKEDCVIHLAEAKQFEIITGVARKPKKESSTCGDSYSFTSVRDGKYMLALSDGMGFGARAAEESSAVISLLENFLEAGFDQSITISTINSILMLRSREEMFATADLCIMDLVKGEAEFIKIGGISSFIRRKDTIDIIRQPALPMGILDYVEPENIIVPIFDEDMVVMVTDGILDAFSAMEDEEQGLADFIATLNTTNPQELAELIMEEALYHTDGDAKDDMTVMAGRVWQPF
ncbi:MAG: stage II sporulation protein E [Clostridiales bacterium]|nr:stage II sporulation protein E [Clostridiales bacterium]